MILRRLAISLALVASVAAWRGAAQGIPRAPAAPAGAGLILGRVVDAASGAPIASVLVTLGSGDMTTALLAGGTDQRRVLTDAQGHFVFNNLAKGSYTLTATVGGNGFSISGFIASGLGLPIGAYLNGGYGQRRPNGPTETIDLAEAQHIGDADIRLWKGAAIDGTIVDEVGEPLIAVVVAAARRSSDGRLLNGPTTRTDDRGMYHLGTLEPGDYVVVVPQTQVLMPLENIEALLASPPDVPALSRLASAGVPQNPTGPGVRVGSSVAMAAAPGGIVNGLPPPLVAGKAFAYRTTFYPAASNAGSATPLRVQSGEDRGGIDIRLQPVATVEVSGTLTDAGGPVPNFAVHLMPADADDGGSVLEAAAAVTTGRGQFVFPLVPAGQYTLLALRNVPVPSGRAAGGVVPSRVSDQPGASAFQSVTVGAQNIGGLSLVVRGGVRVSGRVEFQGGSDLPPDRIRRSLSLVRTAPLFRSAAPPPGSDFPVAGGEFAVAGVPPGRYIVRTSDEAYAGWALQSVTAGGREFADSPLTIADADVSNLLVILTDRPAELSGSVTAANGVSLDDLSVFVFSADRTRWPDARASTRTFRTARVSKDGAFRLPRMIPGEYLAIAMSDVAAGDWPDERLLAVLAGRASPLRIEAGQKATIALRMVDVR